MHKRLLQLWLSIHESAHYYSSTKLMHVIFCVVFVGVFPPSDVPQTKEERKLRLHFCLFLDSMSISQRMWLNYKVHVILVVFMSEI